MRVEHQRKFLPVGHGAFFIERLFVDDNRVMTAVYDCGDSNGGNTVQGFAQTEFGTDQNEKIDILFISHFDSDHVNGLLKIKPYLSSRTRVFLPFYYPHLQNVYNPIKRDGIEQVIGVLGSVHINPIRVRYRADDEQFPDIDVDEYDFDQRESVIDSGQPIAKYWAGIPVWRYVPFNLFDEQKLFNDFKAKVKHKLNWTFAKLDNVNLWTPQDIRILRRVYQSFGILTINDNSLMVLSDARPKHLYHSFICEVSGDYLHDVDPRFRNSHTWFINNHFSSYVSCLFTGDTVLKRGSRSKSKYYMRYEDFLTKLKRYVDKVSLMQCPHHGSGNNINFATLCDCMSLRIFCNFDTSDMSNKVFFLNSTNLKSVWKNIIQVTEQPNTVFEEWSLLYY